MGMSTRKLVLLHVNYTCKNNELIHLLVGNT